MALLDKMKAQAQQVAQKAQEAGRAGQARLEDLQAQRQLAGLYRSLGAALYAEHVGRGDKETTAEIGRLYEEIEQFEKEHGTAALADDDESSPSAP